MLPTLAISVIEISLFIVFKQALMAHTITWITVGNTGKCLVFICVLSVVKNRQMMGVLWMYQKSVSYIHYSLWVWRDFRQGKYCICHLRYQVCKYTCHSFAHSQFSQIHTESNHKLKIKQNQCWIKNCHF